MQGVIKTLGRGAEFDLFGFEHEVAALVAVDPPRRGAAVAVPERDAALEDVGVVACVFPRRVGRGDVEQVAEVGDEELVVRQLRPVGVLPAGEEGFGGQGGHAREYAIGDMAGREQRWFLG